MNPEFEQLKQRVEQLERQLDEIHNPGQINPEFNQTWVSHFTRKSDKAVTDYDQPVDENSTGTYNVPAQFDGLIQWGQKLIGYYDV